MKKAVLSLFCLFGLSIVACQDAGVCIEGDNYANEPKQQALTFIEPVGDTPNQEAYRLIKNSLEQNKPVAVGVYRYQSTVDLDDKIHQDNLNIVLKTEKSLFLEKGDWEYKYDINTSYLDAGNKLKLQTQTRANPEQVQSDAFYYAKSLEWAKQNELLPQHAHVASKPYKLRKYYIGYNDPINNDHGKGLSELAMAFTEFVDGWPVISANKNVVRMDVDGEVIGYSKINKTLGERVYTLTNEDILTPDEALSELYNSTDITPDSAVLERVDFGYFDYNKHNIRTLLAPYYIFILKPIVGSKTLVRPIIAIKNGEVLQAIAADDALETARKQSLIDSPQGDMRCIN